LLCGTCANLVCVHTVLYIYFVLSVYFYILNVFMNA